ncbi:protein-L-isoaspartate O-methyltransferase family protein [Rhodoferax mekongensis]|uniref:protein-L-isoaspartate O-methyltransferase family protein n=1 Tax=Rhodoferax mekongensis TaxID=3068341 RepID=UPI0028BE1C20|nr:protein-L-isoaspartate O-methyltransferase [Rhodoferax sp. TBRC 17199]MDT7514760.1 protein-L-isoaspartate O-methyltransferase [Rhodoferax sp. TBRC 17199]NBX20550.1 protein-L-isoaspartate O-methyltransferase [Betaproteobacteria bacterium]
MHPNQARFNMIEQQIRPWNVLDLQVLDLLANVRRDEFVPAAHKSLAFADLEIPLPAGQCMLAPRLEARMLQDLAVKSHETVLEIGAGSGFMAALLAHRARQVLTLEIVPELAAFARSNLAQAGLSNVTVREADGSKLGASEGKFDVILLSGSVGQIPQDLLQHLNIGGRLGAIVGDDPVMNATIVTRTSETDFRTVATWETMVQRLQGFAEPERFQF